MNEKRTGFDNDKRNMLVVCETDLTWQSTKSWWRPQDIQNDDSHVTTRKPW